MKKTLLLPRPHPRQREIIYSPARRKIVRAGRRGGKTFCAAIMAALGFLHGRRVLYAAPTADQTSAFWNALLRIIQPMLDAKCATQNKTERLLTGLGRVRAKTAWSADGLRGDWADLLIMDEYQLMDESAWGEVGAPMLADRDGDAVFIFTPPSLHSRSVSKARDKRHAVKFLKEHRDDATGRWAEFHFTSRDNPYISQAAVSNLTADMTALAIRQEIDAEIIDQAAGALWNRAMLDACRIAKAPELARIVVALDPSATAGGDAAGIVAAGIDSDGMGYVLEDASIQGSPDAWARAAVACYHRWQADRLVAESNQGGEMVALVIGTIPDAPPVMLIHASRGKQARAEPVSAQFEQGRVKMVGNFTDLEDELCEWEALPGQPSPNRLDAMVYAITEIMLLISSGQRWGFGE